MLLYLEHDEFDYVPSILDGIYTIMISNCFMSIENCGITTITYQNIELIRSYVIVDNIPNVITSIKNILFQFTNKKILNTFIDIFDELQYVCDENIRNEMFTIDKNMPQFIFDKPFRSIVK